MKSKKNTRAYTMCRYNNVTCRVADRRRDVAACYAMHAIANITFIVLKLFLADSFQFHCVYKT